jgi:alanine dehydrogenase
MIIGVPKEIKDQEYRVALLPSAAYQLAKRGHQVALERARASARLSRPQYSTERERGGFARGLSSRATSS